MSRFLLLDESERCFILYPSDTGVSILSTSRLSLGCSNLNTFKSNRPLIAVMTDSTKLVTGAFSMRRGNYTTSTHEIPSIESAG